jgi:HEPN domain-containing protein
MRDKTRSWIDFAQRDLEAAKRLSEDAYFGAIVAYHAQQCVEKCLKGILEEQGAHIPKTHATLHLLQSVMTLNPTFSLGMNDTLLACIDDIYTDVRYPGNRGLLPTGIPTVEQAKELIAVAEKAFAAVSLFLR